MRRNNNNKKKNKNKNKKYKSNKYKVIQDRKYNKNKLSKKSNQINQNQMIKKTIKNLRGQNTKHTAIYQKKSLIFYRNFMVYLNSLKNYCM